MDFIAKLFKDAHRGEMGSTVLLIEIVAAIVTVATLVVWLVP